VVTVDRAYRQLREDTVNDADMAAAAVRQVQELLDTLAADDPRFLELCVEVADLREYLVTVMARVVAELHRAQADQLDGARGRQGRQGRGYMAHPAHGGRPAGAGF